MLQQTLHTVTDWISDAIQSRLLLSRGVGHYLTPCDNLDRHTALSCRAGPAGSHQAQPCLPCAFKGTGCDFEPAHQDEVIPLIPPIMLHTDDGTQLPKELLVMQGSALVRVSTASGLGAHAEPQPDTEAPASLLSPSLTCLVAGDDDIALGQGYAVLLQARHVQPELR